MTTLASFGKLTRRGSIPLPNLSLLLKVICQNEKIQNKQFRIFLTNSLEIKLNDDFTYISDFDVPSSLMPSVAE